jgi:phage I-like protein
MAERASSRQYLVVDEDGKGHLPVRDTPDGPLNHHLMGAAWAALHGGYRGKKYEGPGKEAAIAKLISLYKSEGMELPSLTGEQESRLGIRDSGPLSRIPGPQPRFLMTLAEPPAAGLLRIPIAVTGAWKGAGKEFSIGLDDLNDIRENFLKKPTGEINVDYEHASEVPFGTGGPVLSAGRITRLDEPERFRNGNHQSQISDHKFILWGWYEPTERARQLIANHEYRYISPAIRWGTKDKVTGKSQGTTLTSVALVNKPFLEELPQIRLCEVQGIGTRGQGMGKARAFVSLQQLHVPGPVNQVSVAYRQPEQDSGFGIQDSRESPGSLSAKEKEMAKTLRLKCLTEEHLEKYGLEPEHKGRIGVFDGEELIGIADAPEGWEPQGGDGKDSKALAELFAAEIGLPGKSFFDIAALVKRGAEAPHDQFATLSESIHDGRINLQEAGRLADAGLVSFSTILQAQEAERRVEAAVKAGKVLPKHRAHALKLALSDAAAFATLVEQTRPVVDLRSYGHGGGGEQPTAQQALMVEVNAYAKENKCSLGVALSEVTKRNPDLWQQYSEEIVTAVEAAQEEE